MKCKQHISRIQNEGTILTLSTYVVIRYKKYFTIPSLPILFHICIIFLYGFSNNGINMVVCGHFSLIHVLFLQFQDRWLNSYDDWVYCFFLSYNFYFNQNTPYDNILLCFIRIQNILIGKRFKKNSNFNIRY